jgi:hypothetical protein
MRFALGRHESMMVVVRRCVLEEAGDPAGGGMNTPIGAVAVCCKCASTSIGVTCGRWFGFCAVWLPWPMADGAREDGAEGGVGRIL